jgi:hypothetical protein
MPTSYYVDESLLSETESVHLPRRRFQPRRLNKQSFAHLATKVKRKQQSCKEGSADPLTVVN